MNNVLSLFLLFPIYLQAKTLCEGAVCDETFHGSGINQKTEGRLEKSEKLEQEKKINKEVTKKPSEKKTSHKKSQKSPPVYEPEEETNLPPYFRNLKGYKEGEERPFVFVPKTPANDIPPGLTMGSKIKIVIKQKIVSSPNVPSPVTGEVMDGPLMGATVYGEAYLESDLKRVLFKFSSISGGTLQLSYNIKASGLDVQGRVGAEGDYHAKDWAYGTASFLATTTSIATDSQVERSQNLVGNYVENPSAANSLKKGAAGALGKVAERLADRAAKVPGYTEIEGPIYLYMLLDEDPKVRR